MKIIMKSVLMLVIVTMLSACGGTPEQKSKTGSTTPVEGKADPNDPMSNKGIGPIKNVDLGEIDQTMVAEGEAIYKQMCSACHKEEEKFIGPAPKGIMERRSPEWIMNMILNPEEMVKSDPIAKKLLVEFNFAPMANQNLTEDQARKVLEYFRTLQ